MFAVTPFRATLGAAVVALAALGACSDAQEEPTGPPIPTLDAGADDARAGGMPTGVERVSTGPLNAECSNCVEWSCETGVCGYDTANPPGACCTECDFSQPAEPKPSCEPGGGGGSGLCSDDPFAGEWGVDFCVYEAQHPDGDPLCYGLYCPAEFSCCYGGPHGDGPFGPPA